MLYPLWYAVTVLTKPFSMKILRWCLFTVLQWRKLRSSVPRAGCPAVRCIKRSNRSKKELIFATYSFAEEGF
jgi:hypothetical protein